MGKTELDGAIGSLEALGRTIDNWVLVCAIVVAIFLAAEVIFSVAHWQNEVRVRPLRIAQAQLHADELAQLNNETARLRAQAATVSDALLATQRSVRLNAVVAGLNRTTTELTALRNGASPELVSEAARSFGIIPKLKSFSDTQFDALVTSNGVELEVFSRSLISALKAAYWVAIDRSDASTPKSDGDGIIALVTIHVDIEKAPKLWEVAEALASALTAEGIEARATSMPTPENSSANAIHILIGPKAQ
jgi:hypothetical protein